MLVKKKRKSQKRNLKEVERGNRYRLESSVDGLIVAPAVCSQAISLDSTQGQSIGIGRAERERERDS